MAKISLIIMAAGESSRFKNGVNLGLKKHWIRINGAPLWRFVADCLNARYKFERTIITASALEVPYMRRFCDYEVVEGGNSRQKSLENALKCVQSEFVAVSDAARFVLDFAVLDALFGLDLGEIDCALPAINVADTAFLVDSCGDSSGESRFLEGESFLAGKTNIEKYLNRSAIRLAQTPQISRVSVLKEALKLGDFSDESSAIFAAGGRVFAIAGSKKMDKLTRFEDLKILASRLDLKRESHADDAIRSGFGFDIHRFCENKDLVLCGVKVPSARGLEAHSDGDVALHALCDAILGAIGAGDIGDWFPPSDASLKGVDSCKLLREIVIFAHSVGFSVINADIMIIAESPKIAPFKDAMCAKIAEILGVAKNCVNVKATTAEKLGAIGRSEGICAKAVVSVKNYAEIWELI